MTRQCPRCRVPGCGRQFRGRCDAASRAAAGARRFESPGYLLVLLWRELAGSEIGTDCHVRDPFLRISRWGVTTASTPDAEPMAFLAIWKWRVSRWGGRACRGRRGWAGPSRFRGRRCGLMGRGPAAEQARMARVAVRQAGSVFAGRAVIVGAHRAARAACADPSDGRVPDWRRRSRGATAGACGARRRRGGRCAEPRPGAGSARASQPPRPPCRRGTACRRSPSRGSRYRGSVIQHMSTSAVAEDCGHANDYRGNQDDDPRMMIMGTSGMSTLYVYS